MRRLSVSAIKEKLKIFAKIEWKDTSKNPTALNAGSKNNSLGYKKAICEPISSFHNVDSMELITRLMS